MNKKQENNISFYIISKMFVLKKFSYHMRKSNIIPILYSKYKNLENNFVLFIFFYVIKVGPIYKNDIPSKAPENKLPK